MSPADKTERELYQEALKTLWELERDARRTRLALQRSKFSDALTRTKALYTDAAWLLELMRPLAAVARCNAITSTVTPIFKDKS